MEKIVVNDTNIFIDLYKIGLMEEMFSLPWEIHTTRLVLVEIIREGQQESVNLYVNDGRLHIPELSYEEAISTLHPTLIIRYGTRMPREHSDISLYFVNERLMRLRHGS